MTLARPKTSSKLKVKKSKYCIGNLKVRSCETQQRQSELPNLRLALLGKTSKSKEYVYLCNYLDLRSNFSGLASLPPSTPGAAWCSEEVWVNYVYGPCEVPVQGTFHHLRYLWPISKVLVSILLHLCATALTLMLVLFKVAKLRVTSCCDLCDYPHTPWKYTWLLCICILQLLPD